MSRQRWILLGLLSAMIDICCLSLDAFFNVAHAQTEDLPPKIYVSIPDLAAYWIRQPPILKVVANDDHDPNPRVSAWLNGQLVDVTSPALIENPGIYFLKVEAEDNRFNKSIHSIIFEVLDVPKYQAEITPLWLDYRVDMLSGTVSIEALLLLSNPSFYPRLQIDPHDPRLQNVALCRVSRYSWTMLLTDEDGATVSDPIPLPSEDEAALCDCINQTVIVHFRGKTSVHKMPSGFVVLGVASDSDSPESSFVIETLPSPLKVMVSENIETIIQQFLNTGLFMLCAPPPGGPECKWIPRVGRRPESCTDYFFSGWCLTQGAICEYQYQGFAGSYIEGQASAQDNCVGCIADADCLVTGKVHASLVHVNIRPPCNWQRVNATSAPKFKGKVEISGSQGFGGDNAAIAAGVINVYVHGGSCQFAATAFNGCQVGYQNPISINLGTGYDSRGGSINFSITLTWNGRNSDRCFATGNGVCSETPGASIRAQIVTGMRLRAYANGGITNLFPLWAEANVFDSTADTVIGGRCQNAVKNLRVE